MPSTFSITSASNTILLKENHQGIAVFTVSNASGRAMRARVRLVSSDPIAQEWFTLQSDEEREYAIAETAQISVNISVPPDAPPGTYSIRLDMIGEENPDEDFAEGPWLTFQVPKTVARKKRKFPLWLILAIAGAVIVAGVVVFLVIPKQVTVPGIVERNPASVMMMLEEAKLEVAEEIKEESSETIPDGDVIRTEPPEGEKVKKGTEITLVVSSGPAPVNVPLLVGMEENDAISTLFKASLEGKVTRVFSDLPEGQVVRCNPPENTLVEKGSTVNIFVSKGLEMLTIPHVAGLQEEDVISDFEQAGLITSTTEVFDESVAWGLVISSSPSENITVQKGSTVNLTVSAGWPQLVWDFENPQNELEEHVSKFEGTRKADVLSGFVSQTGGGPSENLSGSGSIVHLVRHLGPDNYPYIEFTTTETLVLDSVTFKHYHNHQEKHNTEKGYTIQLQIRLAPQASWENISDKLSIKSDNDGNENTIQLNWGNLNPGGPYQIRWLGEGFAKKVVTSDWLGNETTNWITQTDSGDQYFAIDDLTLTLLPMEDLSVPGGADTMLPGE